MTIPLQMDDWAEAEAAGGAVVRECLLDRKSVV